MHNQHIGLNQQLAAQHITERQEQAAQARLAQTAGRSRRRRHRWLTRGWWQLVRRPGAALTRALIIGAMLAAMHLAGMTAVAHAQATDQQATRRPPAERQVGESWRHRQAASQDQSAADATLKRVQARERFSIPNATPAKVPAPVPPSRAGSLAGLPPGWVGWLPHWRWRAGWPCWLPCGPAAESGPGRPPDDPAIRSESDGAAGWARQPHHLAGDGLRA
jgi:hypothetical protein